jgi:hypothetical protein
MRDVLRADAIKRKNANEKLVAAETKQLKKDKDKADRKTLKDSREGDEWFQHSLARALEHVERHPNNTPSSSDSQNDPDYVYCPESVPKKIPVGTTLIALLLPTNSPPSCLSCIIALLAVFPVSTGYFAGTVRGAN